jgi:tRNA-Thr(GGU) m(6)t(6)A37 methyltransferase TsaA
LSFKSIGMHLENFKYEFRPIGFLKSCYPDKFGVPRQSGIVSKAYSELSISAQWQPELALEGLSGFSHVWIVFVFHLNNSARYHAKVHPPRMDGASMGVFATRSPHRPNPIGLSLVEIIEVQKDKVIFAGADLVEGTPVLDIKPYLPQFESQPDARSGWSTVQGVKNIEVQFSDLGRSDLKKWIEKTGRIELEEVIVQILQQDPRPVVYKGFESQNSPYRNKHRFRLYEGDIEFEFLTSEIVRVIEIKF